MKRVTMPLLLLLLTFAFAAVAAASAADNAKAPATAETTDANGVKHNVPADLAKQAKVSLEAARASALAKVPGGKVKSEELEKENGKLIYSFDVAVDGKDGIQEVNVSAITGKVLSVHHESAQDEAKEAKADKTRKPPHG